MRWSPAFPKWTRVSNERMVESIEYAVFQTNELVLDTLVMNQAMSLPASTRFQQLSRLTVNFNAGCISPAKCLANFVRHCPRLKKVTAKGCRILTAEFQTRFFSIPVVRLNSRSIRFEFLN